MGVTDFRNYWNRNTEDFLLACKLELFDHEKVTAACKELNEADAKRRGSDNASRTNDEYGVNRIVKVIERQSDQTRMAFWNTGGVTVHGLQCPYYNLVDENRVVINAGHTDYIVEELSPASDKCRRFRDKVANNYRFREELSTKIRQIEYGILFLDTDSFTNYAKKSDKAIEAEIANRSIVDSLLKKEQESVKAYENEELALFIKGMSMGAYDYKKAAEATRIMINANWGRGHFKIERRTIRLKPGRFYDMKTKEYLIAPGLNFGPYAWFHNGYSNRYGREIDHEYRVTTVVDIVKKLATMWKDNVDSTTDYNRNSTQVCVQIDNWLESMPHLRMGIRDKFGTLIEKELRIGLERYDPKTGKEFVHPHYVMNGRRVPKARFAIAMNYWVRTDIKEHELNGFLDQMGKYTHEMLTLPGTTKEVRFSIPSLANGTNGGSTKTEEFVIRFNHRLHEAYWTITCVDLESGRKRVDHDTLRRFLSGLRGSYYSMSDIVKAFVEVGIKLEDFIQAIQVRQYRRTIAEKAREKDMIDMVKKFPNQVRYDPVVREVIVQGKLHRYKITLAGDHHALNDGVAVYNADNNRYICMVNAGNSSSGIAYDTVMMRILMLLNDEVAVGEVGTLRN